MLKLNNISKTFNPGTVNEKTALSGLTLDVHDGDFITIIGANGAGKSTLFNAIAGSFYTDSGKSVLRIAVKAFFHNLYLLCPAGFFVYSAQ